jgi:FkbM family methyltransferase
MITENSNILGQETEVSLLAALLPHVRPTFVDVGAEQGAFGRFLAEKGLRGILFEPLPKHQAALTDLARAFSLRHYNFAIDQKDGEAEFHIACDEAGKPLDFFHSLQPLKDDVRVHHRQTLRVVCRSLQSLHQEGIFDREIGVIKIDTEGNDLRVLRGLGPVRADVLACEFFTPGIYNGWAEAEPLGLIRQAQELGYQSWVAVRRRGACEMVSLNSLHFTPTEWGNLIFLTEPIYKAGWPALSRVIVETEEKLFSQIEQSSRRKRSRWRPW